MSPIELLTSAHDLEGFASGHRELDDWLVRSALHSQRMNTARVYVLVEARVIVGYFAIAPHVVARSEVPPSLGHGSPNAIPSFLLARLAVSMQRQGQGQGAELLIAAIETMLAVMKSGGGRLLVVDAINERAANF